MLKKLLLTTVGLIFAAGAALAVSGNQIGFPVVGGASYCASLGNAGVCNLTIAAGPTVVTGNETVVANTNLGSGQNPQTVLLSMASINALPAQYVAAPLSAGTLTLTNLTGAVILDPAGVLNTYTIFLPVASTLVDGQTLELSSSFSITTLTMVAGTGSTISNSPTALTVSTTAAYGYKFLYNLAQTKWFRVQ